MTPQRFSNVTYNFLQQSARLFGLNYPCSRLDVLNSLRGKSIEALDEITRTLSHWIGYVN